MQVQNTGKALRDISLLGLFYWWGFAIVASQGQIKRAKVELYDLSSVFWSFVSPGSMI